jgi:hypothetical protein
MEEEKKSRKEIIEAKLQNGEPLDVSDCATNKEAVD